MIDEVLKSRITSRLQKVYNHCKIYLFGSYAYGDPKPGSDLDLAVILTKVESKVHESLRVTQLLSDLDYPKDILVCSEDEFEFYRHEAGSIFRTIAEKGILLNG